jgi:hypothetical protein
MVFELKYAITELSEDSVFSLVLAQTFSSSSDIDTNNARLISHIETYKNFCKGNQKIFKEGILMIRLCSVDRERSVGS